MFDQPITKVQTLFVDCGCVYPLWHLRGDPRPHMLNETTAAVKGSCPACTGDNKMNIINVSARTSYTPTYTAVMGVTFQSGRGHRYRAVVKSMMSDSVVFHEWFAHPETAHRWISRYYPHKHAISADEMAAKINHEGVRILR